MEKLSSGLSPFVTTSTPNSIRFPSVSQIYNEAFPNLQARKETKPRLNMYITHVPELILLDALLPKPPQQIEPPIQGHHPPQRERRH
jgi:hypothetical protein